jgi:hypothetical protein
MNERADVFYNAVPLTIAMPRYMLRWPPVVLFR